MSLEALKDSATFFIAILTVLFGLNQIEETLVPEQITTRNFMDLLLPFSHVLIVALILAKICNDFLVLRKIDDSHRHTASQSVQQANRKPQSTLESIGIVTVLLLSTVVKFLKKFSGKSK